MAAKMAVYHKKYKKSSLRPTKSRDLHAKCFFTDCWTTDIILVIPVMLSLSIWHIQDGVQDRSQQIFQTHGSGTLHVGIMMDL